MQKLRSDTPKWVFHGGGGIPPPPSHPEISEAGSNRVKRVFIDRKSDGFLIIEKQGFQLTFMDL